MNNFEEKRENPLMMGMTYLLVIRRSGTYGSLMAYIRLVSGTLTHRERHTFTVALIVKKFLMLASIYPYLEGSRRNRGLRVSV